MNISVNLAESTSDIEQMILGSLKNQVEKTISSSIPSIINDIKTIVNNALKLEPEYGSLVSGKLRAEFGIADTSSVDRVIEFMVNTINIQKTPIKVSRSGLSGGFTLTMMDSDTLGGAMDIRDANVYDESGYVLPWLRWLLLENNKTIIKNYDVKYGPSPMSRSGMAFMVPSSGSWRVPAEFVGSKNNNWTTRAVERSENEIYAAIKRNIEKNI